MKKVGVVLARSSIILLLLAILVRMGVDSAPTYYDNGVVASEGVTVFGAAFMNHVAYDSLGHIQYQQYFLAGYPHGPGAAYSPKGKLVMRSWHQFGKLHWKDSVQYPGILWRTQVGEDSVVEAYRLDTAVLFLRSVKEKSGGRSVSKIYDGEENLYGLMIEEGTRASWMGGSFSYTYSEETGEYSELFMRPDFNLCNLHVEFEEGDSAGYQEVTITDVLPLQEENVLWWIEVAPKEGCPYTFQIIESLPFRHTITPGNKVLICEVANNSRLLAYNPLKVVAKDYPGWILEEENNRWPPDFCEL